MNEQALLLGPSRALVTIYTPACNEKNSDVAVILLNSGLIHHVGPSRVYVKIARALAESNIACFRFDLSSIGDSPVRADNLSIYEIATTEPIEIMDDLQKRGFNRFILSGICAGAYCAFQTATIDTRVIGSILINPEDLSGDAESESKAWAKRYWSNSLFRPSAWVNLFTGRVNYKRLFSTLGGGLALKNKEEKNIGLPKQDIKKAMKDLLTNKTSILFITSGKDISQEYLTLLFGKKSSTPEQISRVIIDGADHLFSRLDHQQQLIKTIKKWTISIIN